MAGLFGVLVGILLVFILVFFIARLVCTCCLYSTGGRLYTNTTAVTSTDHIVTVSYPTQTAQVVVPHPGGPTSCVYLSNPPYPGTDLYSPPPTNPPPYPGTNSYQMGQPAHLNCIAPGVPYAYVPAAPPKYSA